jgi:CDP-6-deoxy-D-xylo-4-hexulose-3-dehydrase
LPDGYDHKYIYAHAGYNLKITDMQAACGLAQLGKVKQFLKARRENFRYFMRKLDGLADHLVLPHATENSDPSWFGFPLTLRENQVRGSRPTLLQYLEKKKIGTRLLFGGNLVKQPYFKNNPYRIYGELKNTDLVMRNTFWLGLHPGIDAERREFISDSLLRYFE